MIYGYARVSSYKQAKFGYSLEDQEVKLKENGAIEIYQDVYTGTTMDRPQFNELLGKLQEGDTLVVTKLDRMSRTVAEGIETIEGLIEKGVKINILNMGVLDNSTQGKLIRNIMLAFAEYERDMIITRTQEGLAIARQKPGFKCGKPPLEYDTEKAQELYNKTVQGIISQTDAYNSLGVSRSSWFKIRKELSA